MIWCDTYKITPNEYYYKKNKIYYPADTSNLYIKNTDTKEFKSYTLPDYGSFSSELFKIADSKETKYVSFDYKTKPGIEYANLIYTDWRELIYLMARDYYQHNEELDYNKEL